MTEKAFISPYIYYVLVEVDPENGADYIHWLNTKHIADVVNFPGVLWGRKVALEEPAEDGWKRFMVVYGFATRKEFEDYRSSDLFKSFANELKPFERVYRLTRMSGQIDLSLG